MKKTPILENRQTHPNFHRVKAKDILNVLYHPPTAAEVCFKELRWGAGYGGVAERRIDLFIVKTGPATTHRATAYEIKISRKDFWKDVKDHNKQRGARLFADRFYYATPPGLVKPEEVPVWAGLMEVNPVPADGRWAGVRIVVPAPVLDKERPSWGLVVAVARNVANWGKEMTAQAKVHDLTREIWALKSKIERLELERNDGFDPLGKG